MATRFPPQEKRQKKVVHNVQNGILTRRIGENNINKWTFEGLNGVQEYAVYGWVKWDFIQGKQPWHNIYRFSGMKEGMIQNMSKIGDRDLVCWVGNGYLHFSTYSFNWHGGHNVNAYQNVNYGQDLNNWFFIYQGHSYKEHKTVAYVKFANSEKVLTWENNWHMLADDATFYLGKDPFYPAFNGDLKNWNVAFGDGAFRTSDFQQLYQQTTFVGNNDNTLVEPEEPSAKLYKSQTSQKDSVLSYSVPKEELSEVQDTSYSYWFRWNFFEPNDLNLGAFRGHWLAMSSLSENDRCGVAVNDRWQSIWLQHFSVGKPVLHFTTYASNKNNWNYWQNMPFEDVNDFDASWNFLYYGYSHRTQKLFAYVKFGRSGHVQTLEFEPSSHSNPPAALTFRLGQCVGSPSTFNGMYWNPRFYYKGNNFLGSKESVDAYFPTSAKPTLFLPPAFKKVNLIKGETEFAADAKEPMVFGPIEGVEGAQEYAIYGWAKWNYIPNKQAWHLLYRHSNWGPDKIQNINKYGDRDQVCWVGNGFLHTSNYNFNFNGQGDNWNWWKNSNYEDDLESWFWFYQGYSQTDKKTFWYVKFHGDRIITHTWDNNNHAVLHQPYIYLGKDTWHPGFSGFMKNVNVIYGPGAFRDKDFDKLQGEELIQPEFDNDNFWKKEPVEVKSDFQNNKDKSWTTIDVPQSELANIKEYSFSAYVRFSMSDPRRQGVGIPRSNWRGIMGITEKDEYCNANQPGKRTLALYDSLWGRAGAPSYHFTTYGTNKNNNNMWQDMSYDERDLDGSWNWVYFGYSLEMQRAFAFVKFGRSGETKSLMWEQIAHDDNIKKLRFILGNCGMPNWYGFHGNFYDVRFRYDDMAFKHNEEHALHYLKNSIPSAPAFNPAYTQIPLTDCQQTHAMADPLRETFEYPWEFNGAEEYAVWGWAKWTPVRPRATWHQLFRVTVNEMGKDNANLGDRTLAVWIGNGIIHFTTYTFGLKSGRVVNSVKNVKYGNDLDSWFFIYFGYNWKTFKAQGFVKFQDRTEVVVFENHRHFIPRYFRVYLAKDPYYKSFNGQMRGFNFAVGDGAFKEGDYEALYEAPYSCSKESVESNKLLPSHESLVKPDQEFLGPEQLIMKEDDLAGITKYGFYTWTKWSFRSPAFFGKIDAWRGKCYTIGRVVAVKGEGIVAYLCVEGNGNIIYRFRDTYAKTNVDVPVTERIRQIVDRWVWIYYSHSQQAQENQIYIYFAASGEGITKYQASINHPAVLPRLQFKLGGRMEGQFLWNGYFFGAQFLVGDVAWIKDFDKKIKDLAETQKETLPSSLNEENLNKQAIFLPVKANNDFNVNQKSNPVDSSKIITGFQDVDEYAVFGWTKLYPNNLIQKTDWTFLFRFTINDADHLDNLSKIGDRTMCIWIHKSLKFVWVGYDFEFPGASNLNTHDMNRSPSFTLGQLQDGFFFTYMAYSPKKERLFMYLQLADGTEHQVPVDGINQLRSSYFAFYLGVDFDGTKTYKAFDGKFKYWHVALGRGSYSENVADLEKFKKIASETGYIDSTEDADKEEQQDGENIEGNENSEKVDDDDENDGGKEEEQGDIDQSVEESEENVPLEDNQATQNEEEGADKGQGAGNQGGGEQQQQESVTESEDDHDEGDDDDDDDEEDQQKPPAPAGDCVILYSDCGFKGEWENICDRNPKIYIDVKSIYVPEGLRIKLYNLPHFEGKTAIFHHTVECIDNIDFKLLQKYGIKIVQNKSLGLTQNIRKKNFIEAKVLVGTNE
uniref:Carboxy-terminal crystallin fold protein n=1 Tax=Philasterides dicentrarchi TaxID=282688 RepID=A0A2Z4NAH5_9CILI|nr:carboxy-terminal crystallin fold protein [Philasterides dicentrarchi]